MYFLDTTHWFIGTSILPNSEFPIIFDSIKGKCEKSSDNSCFNTAEVDAVVQYIMDLSNFVWNGRPLLQSDIGVISPYRAQCDKIILECQRFGFSGVTVGTVEIFQGQERPVIIISMVRSGGDLTDFVINGKVTYNMNCSFESQLIFCSFRD